MITDVTYPGDLAMLLTAARRILKSTSGTMEELCQQLPYLQTVVSERFTDVDDVDPRLFEYIMDLRVNPAVKATRR